MTRCEHRQLDYTSRVVSGGALVLTTEVVRCTQCEERVVWSTAQKAA